MQVVHIVRGDYNSNALNGVYKIIHSLSIALSKLGVNVTVCSVTTHYKEIYDPIVYTHIRVKESNFLFSITSTFEDFLKNQPKDTIFHFHSVFIPWFLSTMKFLQSNGYKNIVLAPHGQYTDIPMKLSLKKQIFFKLFDAKVIRLTSIIHLTGNNEKNTYIVDNASKYVLIPNGCDKVINRLKELKKELVFGYLGRFEIAQKGLDILLDSFLKYKLEGGKGVLRLAGNGSDKQKLIEKISFSPFKEAIYFDGVVFDDKKWEFLNQCAFFCHPSRWDGLPMAAIEAAACGVPLIVTHATNMSEYVEKFNAGIVLDPNNTEKSLLEAFHNMESLFYKSEEYSNISSNALQMVETELNWDVIAKKVIDFIYIPLS